MEELCWINGSIYPLSQARISVEDRGFVFADGVYEVIRVYQGQAFAVKPHLIRLWQSCEGIEIVPSYPMETIGQAIRDLITRSRMGDGIVYLQVTRGIAPRGHSFPQDVSPTVMIYVRSMSFASLASQRVISVKDDRWHRCWIKSIALLPNVLAKQSAVRAGADEAIFVDEGQVQEGATSNVAIIQGQTLITPAPGEKVLPGITRQILLELAKQQGMNVLEKSFTLEEAYAADEALLASTTREVVWISEWDGHRIGSGQCGKWTRQLGRAFEQYRDQSFSGSNDLPDSSSSRIA